MGWWVERYKAAAKADPTERTSTRLATALVFDFAGVTPGLKAPMEILELGHVLLEADVADLVEIVLGVEGFTPGRQNNHEWKPPRGRPMLMLGHYYYAGARIDARNPARGVPVFAAAHDADMVQPERSRAMARVIKAVVDEGLVRAFAHEWYEDGATENRFAVPERAALHDIVLAATATTTVAEFKARLFDICKLGAVAVAVRDESLSKTKGAWSKQDDEDEQDQAEVAALERRAAAAPKTTPKLSEMKGFGEAREWGLRLAADLHARDVGELSWDDVDKGILLSGEPGTGKTTFARALALEADAHFEAITYGSFEAGGAYVVKSMKKQFDGWRAKAKTRPVIVFFDEIDSMGVRGKNAHNDSYWGAIINALLDFLDGAEPRTGVVFIGATNFVDRIDPALMRPGRLERNVVLPMPGVDEMCDVVAYHLDVDPKAPETRKAAIALRGLSPADVAMWAREARRMGRLFHRKADGGDLADLAEWSRPKLHPRQDRLVRIHESGHAIATLTMEAHGWTLAQVDTQASRRAGSEVEGTVESKLPPWTMTRRDIVRQIAQTLAGRAAEEAHIGEVSVGARADLQNATALAAKAIRQEGLGRSLLHVAPDSNLTDEHLVEIELMIGEGYELAKQCVAGWDVPWLAERLKTQRFMSGDEVRTALRAAIAEVFFREESAPEPAWYEPSWEDFCPPEALAA